MCDWGCWLIKSSQLVNLAFLGFSKRQHHNCPLIFLQLLLFTHLPPKTTPTPPLPLSPNTTPPRPGRRKMENATTLISALGGEEARWSAQSKAFEEGLAWLVGDCVVASRWDECVCARAHEGACVQGMFHQPPNTEFKPLPLNPNPKPKHSNPKNPNTLKPPNSAALSPTWAPSTASSGSASSLETFMVHASNWASQSRQTSRWGRLTALGGREGGVCMELGGALVGLGLGLGGHLNDLMCLCPSTPHICPRPPPLMHILPVSQVSSFLADDTEVGQWNVEGLPTDDLSVQNGILVTRATRYPLLVDPQGQVRGTFSCLITSTIIITVIGLESHTRCVSWALVVRLCVRWGQMQGGRGMYPVPSRLCWVPGW